MHVSVVKVVTGSWLHVFEADDVFISYSRLDGNAYVIGLDAALSARGFSCFSDKRGTDAQALPPQTLYEKVRRCKTLVLLGTPGAVRRPEYIAPEVREFAAANGTSRIIPISFDRGVDLMDWSTAPWYDHVIGKSRERETVAALTTGVASEEIVDNIVAVSDYMKGKDRLRLYRRNTLAIFVALLLASVAAAVVAFWFSKRARIAAAEAVRQQTIADARASANRSHSVLREHPELLNTSIDLALAGMKEATAIGIQLADADAAVRQSVALLPRPMGRQRFRGALTSPTLTADGLHFAALDGERLRVYRIGYAPPVKDVAVERGDSLAVSNDAGVAAIETDRALVIYHLNGERRVAIRKPISASEPEFTLQAMALSPTGQYLVTLAITGYESTKWGPPEIHTVTVWDTQTGRRIADPSLGVGWQTRDVTFTVHGDLVVAKSGDDDSFATLDFWYLGNHLDTGRPIEQFDFGRPGDIVHFQDTVSHVARDSGEYCLVTDTVVWKRDALGNFFPTHRFLPAQPSTPAFSQFTVAARGTELLVVRPRDGFVDVERWDISDRRSLSCTLFPRPVTYIAFSRLGRPVAMLQPEFRHDLAVWFLTGNGRYAATVQDAASLSVRDIWLSTEMPVNHASAGEVRAVAVTPAGGWLGVTAAVQERMHASVFTRRGSSYSRIASFDVGDDPGWSGASLALSPDGRHLFYGDGVSARIFDARSGEDLTPRTLQELSSVNERWVASLELSPLGQFLALRLQKAIDAVKSFDPREADEIPEELVVMRLSDNTIITRISHERAVSTTAFSANENWLFVAGHDRKSTLVALREENKVEWRRTDSVTVTAARFDAGARRLATGSADGVVEIFDPRNPGTPMVRLVDAGSITAIAFSPDGKRIATASAGSYSSRRYPDENHAMRIWLLDPRELIADARSRVTRSLRSGSNRPRE